MILDNYEILCALRNFEMVSRKKVNKHFVQNSMYKQTEDYFSIQKQQTLVAPQKIQLDILQVR